MREKFPTTEWLWLQKEHGLASCVLYNYNPFSPLQDKPDREGSLDHQVHVVRQDFREVEDNQDHLDLQEHPEIRELEAKLDSLEHVGSPVYQDLQDRRVALEDLVLEVTKVHRDLADNLDPVDRGLYVKMIEK